MSGKLSGDPSRVPPARTIGEALKGALGGFTFEQAVRLLELVDGSSRPGVQSVRFETAPFLSHPTAALSPAMRRAALTDPRPAVTFHGFGLTGANGAMPFAYSADVAAFWKEHYDARGHRSSVHEAPQAFLDIFNDRLIGLYYEAWSVNQIGLRYEGDEGASPERVRPTDALIGLGVPGLMDRAAPSGGPFERGTFRFFTAMLAAEGRSAAALHQTLVRVLELPLAVNEFTGKWLRLPPRQRGRLGRGRHASDGALGRSSQMLGDRAWCAGAGLRIEIGPLALEDFRRLLPDAPGPKGGAGQALAELAAFVRFFVGPTIDFELHLLLDPAEIRAAELGAPMGRGMNRLGVNGFLKGTSKPAGPRFRFVHGR